MIPITDKVFEEFIETAHALGTSNLTICSSGNLSLRYDNDYVLLSGTGTWLPKIKREDIAIAEIATGKLLNNVRPSMESGFHFGILKACPETNVVLHCSPFYATTIACRKNRPANYNVVAEVPIYCNNIVEVPYTRPGSPELAQRVIAALTHNNVALLLNHGIAVKGKNMDDAFQKAAYFEMACRIIIQSNDDYQVLTPENIAALDQYIKGKAQK